MKYYKHNNEIRAIEEGQDLLIQSDWIELSQEEVEVIINPPPTTEQLADQARAKRDSLLSQSDWTQLDDSPLKGDTTWLDYRQALRDVTEQAGFPETINWPVKP